MLCHIVRCTPEHNLATVHCVRRRVKFFSLLTLCPRYFKAFEDTVLVSPAQTDMAGLTPLMYACTSNLEESIKYLLKKKVRLGGTGLSRVG